MKFHNLKLELEILLVLRLNLMIRVCFYSFFLKWMIFIVITGIMEIVAGSQEECTQWINAISLSSGVTDIEDISKRKLRKRSGSSSFSTTEVRKVFEVKKHSNYYYIVCKHTII